MRKPLSFKLPRRYKSKFAKVWREIQAGPSARERLIEQAATKELDGDDWRAAMDEWLNDLAMKRWSQAITSMWSVSATS